MPANARWLRVGSLEELGQAGRLVREIGGTSILLCRVAGRVVAVRNACTHLGKPLSEGRVMAGRIHCPFHGACFDLVTGEALSGPAVAGLRRYPVKVESGSLFVEIDDGGIVRRSGSD
jgi:nitrite reductase/ring-hydroxylating ferredoxin subunit